MPRQLSLVFRLAGQLYYASSTSREVVPLAKFATTGVPPTAKLSLVAAGIGSVRAWVYLTVADASLGRLRNFKIEPADSPDPMIAPAKAPPADFGLEGTDDGH
ncbi:MAG: hypothetical protein K2W85_16415 [Phycisphaerales bacterium]|nr:hypothetical protein [Phycisphaerales bacterium]